jgi:glycosyltransferase involved in cell wall biosynthesis
MSARVLHAYDFLLAKGGAEAVALQLCNDYESMDLLVSFVNTKNYPKPPLSESRLLNLRSRWRNSVLQALFVSREFAKSALVREYEKVVFSGSYAPLSVVNRTSNGNIMYCHTPPRFVYDLKEHYLTSIPLWQRPLLKLLIAWFRPQYEKAVEQMDLIIANSENVQQRIKKFLGKESVIIYPPCDTNKYTWMGQGDYYLSTARLEEYKRVDLIVEAFIKMPDKKLIVASGGSELNKLKELAKGASNITFTGWCSEQQLVELMGNCIATIYVPMDEDFGISPVESMSAGKPVIGVNEGGVTETVIDKETGYLCPSPLSVEGIIRSVNILSAEAALNMRSSCELRAQSFDKSTFFRKMKVVLNTNNPELSRLSQQQLDDTFANEASKAEQIN